MTEVRDGTARGLAAAGGPLVQLRVEGGRAVAEAVTALEPREIPVLATFDEPWPAGRDQVIGEVAAELAATLSVQLYGAPGAGKKAIARAVIRRLGSGPNPVRGVELWPPAGAPQTLGRLYERLAHLFFAGTTFQPPEPRLRAAAAAAGLTAVVVIGDCELSSRDLARLLGTFPDCAFLLTSRQRTLFSSGVAHEVGPLPLDAAVELIARQTSQHPAALGRLQVAQAYNLAAGQTGRLLQHAAWLRLTGGQAALAAPPEQAAALAASLSEPAGDVLAALATFGTEVAPDALAAVTGRPVRPAAGPAMAEAGAELRAAALVILAGAAGGGAAYRITPDALAAVTALGWAPASAVTAGRGLLQRLGGRDGGPPPSPALVLAVAGRLHAGGADHEAASLIRAALPAVLAAGSVQDWMLLLRLGLAAAAAAGAAADLEYFAGEDGTRRRLLGEAPAAVPAGAEQLTEPIGAFPAGPGPGPGGGPGRAGRRAGPGGPGEAGRGGRPPRRSGARILLAGYGIPVIVIVVILAVAGVLAVRSLDRPGTAAPGARPTARATGGTTAGAGSGPAARRAPSASGRPRPAARRPRPSPSHPRSPAGPARPSARRPRASASSPRPASPSATPAPTTAAAVVRAYFAAINARQYQQAWALGGRNLTPSYAQFVAGFASTSSDTVAVGPTAGNVVGVLLTAAQTDGTTKFYSGTYTVSGGAITGSDIQQTG